MSHTVLKSITQSLKLYFDTDNAAANPTAQALRKDGGCHAVRKRLDTSCSNSLILPLVSAHSALCLVSTTGASRARLAQMPAQVPDLPDAGGASLLLLLPQSRIVWDHSFLGELIQPFDKDILAPQVLQCKGDYRFVASSALYLRCAKPFAKVKARGQQVCMRRGQAMHGHSLVHRVSGWSRTRSKLAFLSLVTSANPSACRLHLLALFVLPS